MEAFLLFIASIIVKGVCVVLIFTVIWFAWQILKYCFSFGFKQTDDIPTKTDNIPTKTDNTNIKITITIKDNND